MIVQPHSSPSLNGYRADIDGLRAIAVLAVVIFHAYPAEFSAGYFGVDIFFVISGYLITGIILADLKNGTFNIARFYASRIKRIFPALIIVLFLTLATGWFSLLAEEYRQLGKYTASGAGFVANIVFWVDTSYFDISSEKKPLLHLWSLGVEEQFYFAFPFLIRVLYRNGWRLGLTTSVLCAFSFVYCLTVGQYKTESAFYLPQSRFWELLAGALLAIHAQKLTADVPLQWLSNTRSAVGFTLINVAFFKTELSSTLAGLWGLLPVLGTVLLLSARQAWVNQKILTLRALVWVGKISYPLYLWHWVLLSFCHIFEDSKPFHELRNPIILVSFLLAWLTYRWIEVPVRFGRMKHLKTRFFVYPMVAILFAGVAVWMSDGVPVRAAASVKVANLGDIGHSKFNAYLKDNFADCLMTRWSFTQPDGSDESRCARTRGDPDQIELVLLGDSHAEHLFIGLTTAFPRNSMLYATRGGLPLISNPSFRAEYDFAVRDPHIKGILISAHWASKLQGVDQKTFEKDLLESLEYFLKSGKHVYLFDDVPIFPINAERCAYVDRLFISNQCSVPLTSVQRNPLPLVDITQKLKTAYPNFSLIDPATYICDQSKCSMAVNGILIYRDRNHLNINGSTYIAEQLKSTRALVFSRP